MSRAKLSILIAFGFAFAAAAPSATAAGRDSARPAGPVVNAASAVLVDARDGHVLYSRGAQERRPIASTTKLMTALISIERLPLRRRLRADVYHAAAAESKIDLQPGERMSVADLLRALMLASANDAAATLARGAGGGSLRAFVAQMNRKARALGLTETHYANPVGLDERGNYSSARDLAAVARVLLREPFIADTADMPRARLLTGARTRIVVNRNDLVGRVPWIVGLKTGHTAQAGYVLVGVGARKGARLISAVLGTPSEAARDDDTLALMRYGFAQYRRIAVMRPGRVVARAKVSYFGDRSVAIEPARRVAVTVRRGERIRSTIDVPRELDGPLRAGAEVGRATVFVGGRRVRSVPLVTAGAVPHAGIARKLSHWVTRPLVVIAILGVVIGVAELRRRRIADADAARRRRRQAARLD